MDLLLEGGSVLRRGDAAQAEPLDVLISGPEIHEVGAGLRARLDAEGHVYRRLDASRRLILPGFVNAHAHSNESFEQGVSDTLPLELWRLRCYPPFDALLLSEEDHYLRAMLFAIASIKSGVTAVQDDVITPNVASHAAVDGACRAYRDVGLRASVTTSLGDLGLAASHTLLGESVPERARAAMAAVHPPHAADQLDLFERNYAAWNGAEGRLSIILGPRAPQRCSRELLGAVADRMRTRCIPVHTHVLETRTQAVGALQEHGATLIEVMDQIGLLHKNLTINHGIWLTEHDVRLLAEADVKVTHNPLSNLKLGSGICAVDKLRAAGVTVALGTDGMTTSDTADMLAVMRAAATLSRICETDFSRWVSAEAVLCMATEAGASSLGYAGRLGSIEPGYLADLVMVDLDHYSYVPLNRPALQTVFSATPEAVRTVVVNGEVVMLDRVLQRIDERAVMQQIRARAEWFRDNALPRTLGAASVVSGVFEEMYWRTAGASLSCTVNPKPMGR